MLPLYCLTIFLSAALLFLVQPMFAKMVLPLLGGTPEVWNTCMVFFQAMLLAGYGYAHAATQWMGVRRQAVLHVAIMLVPLAVLPIAVPSDATPPTESLPIGWLLGLLSVAVGAPFFVVSTTAPLLQRWFAETRHSAADDPYFLYAASNAGSLLALVSFPLLFEPTLRLTEQAWVWSVSYCLLIALVAGCAAVMWRSGPQPAMSGRPVATKISHARPVDGRRRLRWLALSMAPASWLLGVTTYLTTDIAPVPLLWIVPLVLYLLSFIMVFAQRPLVPHAWLLRLLPLVLMMLVVTALAAGIWHGMLLHLVAFFCAALVCHGELARDRPTPAHLTEFYLWMSLGGVLGGAFNALLAPVLFSWLLEYPLTVALTAWLMATARPAEATLKSRRPHPGPLPEGEGAARWPRIAALAAVTLCIAVFLSNVESTERPVWLVVAVIASLLVLSLLYLAGRPRWFAAVLAVPLLLDAVAAPFPGEVLFTGRGYFGMHRVIATVDEDYQQFHHLMHGDTIHGRQSRDPGRQCEPLTYYHTSGPLGQAMAAFDGSKRRVAIVGLGSGAMACYAGPKAEFTFYEIDPLVRHIAETPAYFSYLSQCAKGRHTIELGDGRLRLAGAADGSYDLMIFDAFSSDAVPVHLLTREALALYLRKLSDGGVLLFHTTNTHLDLSIVLATLAAEARLVCRACHDFDLSEEEFRAGKSPSSYVAICRDSGDLGPLATDPRWREPIVPTGARPWTDDYSNILGVLKW